MDSTAGAGLYLCQDLGMGAVPGPDLAQSDLTRLFGLDDLARRVARVDADGQKRKMRKSYQKQIEDLPGKNKITKDDFLQRLVFQPFTLEPVQKVTAIPAEQADAAFDVHFGPLPDFDGAIFDLDTARLTSYAPADDSSRPFDYRDVSGSPMSTERNKKRRQRDSRTATPSKRAKH